MCDTGGINALTNTIIGVATAALLVPFAVPSIAQAVDLPKPSKSVCSKDGVANKDYACMKVNAKKVPSGETATFTGNLSKSARKNLESWTRGEKIVCLTRYRTKPETYGWPSQVLEAACTAIRKNGEFTINVELGRKGTYYYGIEMGPCRAKNIVECDEGDPGLIGVGSNKTNKALRLKTT
ncbi:MAG: hypothetical protein OSA11_07965 [Candidatus Nanopelagicales bacterium]|nr:hypothetical protein [Candidatus Nanopelagicales bacterium]